MNKSKITKINVKSSQKTTPSINLPISSNLSASNQLRNNLPTANNLPTLSKVEDNIEFEHYSFTTPLNTIKLEKCKDLRDSSNSSNDYSIELTNKLNSGNKNDKKCFFNQSNRDANNDTNAATASEFASYTEPADCKLPNSSSLNINSLSDSFSLNQDGITNERQTTKRISRNKINLNRKKNLNKPKFTSPSIPVDVYPKMTICPHHHQKCLIGKQNEFIEEDKEKFKLSRCEFLLFCISSSINLGNIWRFPHMVYKNNGGTFLIPYLVCSMVIGFPILLIELTLGQYSAMNSVHLFKNLVPIWRGLSHISVLTAIISLIYLNLILSWILIYLFESFFGGMRWRQCDKAYSSINCTNLESIKYNNGMINRSLIISSEDFFNNQFLNNSSNADELTKINWTVLFALFIVWLILFILLSFNIKNSGKIVYLVATFPYLILFFVFLKCITLNNATEGLIFFMIPNINKLKDVNLWKDATVQVLISFGLTGSMLTYASKNKFYNPVVNYAILVWSINTLTSLFICFIMFSIIGYFSSILRRPVDCVLTSGIGFLFILIPDRLGVLQYRVLWSSLFFLVLLIIGLNSQLTLLEVICTFLNDLMHNRKKSRKILNYLAFCMLFFFINLIFSMKIGVQLMEIFDYYFNGLIYLCLAFMELIIVSYIFGIDKFFTIMKIMKCWHSKLILKSHLIVLITSICPFIILYLININFVQILNIKEHNQFINSDKLTDLFYYSILFLIILNLIILLYGFFQFIFIQKPKINSKLSVWIKIRFGFEQSNKFNSNFNSIKSKNIHKYLNNKKYQINFNQNYKNNTKLFKNKDNNIIIF